MDHEWFNAVGKKLAEIEHAKAQRFKLQTGQIDKELYLHPMISSSVYWHKTDGSAPSMFFDWTMPRFPTQYYRYISREDRSIVEKLARRAYKHDVTDNINLENSKTLMARIVLLKLEYLLPVVA